jgi:hypothetical protein
MNEIIYKTKKVKKMKKFIYALIILASLQFVQAQEITGSYFYEAPSTKIPLDGIDLTMPPVATITENTIIGLSIALELKNTGSQLLRINDTVFVQLVFNGGEPLVLTFFMNLEVNTNEIVLLLYDYPVRVGDMKSGEYANRLCAEVIKVSYSGVQTPVTQTPYCADMTISGITTDIAKANVFKDVKLYPNPVRDNNLKIENVNESTDISLYDIRGQLIQRQAAVRGNTSIDVSKLSNGLYMLKMQNGKNIRTEKIEIIR